MKKNLLLLGAAFALFSASVTAQSKLVLAKAEVPLNATTWVSAYENSYTYSANGARTSDTWQERLDVAGNLENVYRYNFTNNASGQPTVAIYETWDSTTNGWLKQDRRLYTYNAQGGVTKIELSQWNSSNQTWGSVTQDSTFTYTNGRISQMIGRFNQGSGLVNTDKVVYTYLANGKLQKMEHSSWNNNTNAWTTVNMRHNFTYNAAGKIQQEVKENYDYAGMVWYILSEENHTYDAQGRETLYLQRVAEPNVPIYNFFKEEFTAFNSSLQYTSGNTFIYDTGMNVWNPFLRNTYTYQTFVGTEEGAMVDTNFGMVFPNPAAERVTIRLNEHPNQPTRIQIYNTLGVLVQSNELKQQETTLSLEGLPSAMYFARIIQGNSFQSLKLQVVR